MWKNSDPDLQHRRALNQYTATLFCTQCTELAFDKDTQTVAVPEEPRMDHDANFIPLHAHTFDPQKQAVI